MKIPNDDHNGDAQARSSLARGSQFLVWWLNEADYCGFEPQQEKNPLKLPDYIWDEFCARCGRPGRARLWVPDGINVEKMDAEEGDPRFDQYMDAGGIVIRAKDAPACALWGGRFTDMALNPLDFANASDDPRAKRVGSGRLLDSEPQTFE